MIRRLLKPFTRITSGAKIIPEVEGLRFVAITVVFLYHLHEEILRKESVQLVHGSFDGWLLAVLAQFGIAVQLFFAISGFILALRFAQNSLADGPQVSLKAYFLRRFTRLEPPYIVCLLLTMPLAVMIAGGVDRFWPLMPHLFASMTYTHGLFYRTRSLINGVSWSLEVEIQFYILAPLFALVYRLRSPWRRYLVYVVTTVGAMVWQSFHSTEVARLFLPSYLQFFVVGFFLADIYVTQWKCKPPVGRRGDLLAMVGWLSLFPLLVLGHSWALCLLPVCIAVAYIGVFTGTFAKRLLSNPVITTIGGMCYTIYLYHFSIIIVVSRLTFHAVFGRSFLLNLLVQTVLLGGITIGCSFLLFALFERPFMERQWPQRLLAHLKPRSATARPAQ